MVMVGLGKDKLEEGYLIWHVAVAESAEDPVLS
jgi:hypothetical protein